MKKTFFLLILSALSFCTAQAQSARPPYLTDTPSRWVDSVFNSLTPDERIAQLIMVAAYSNRDEAHAQEIEKLVTEQKIGGLVFFQGGPVRQAALTNRYQAKADVPLLVAIDGEWGLGMRLDSTIRFPYQMTLGALADDSLIYQMGREVAREARRMGIHVNFAPVADVNNNPNNPVINYRSFGSDRENVAQKSIAYMRGMQDGGLLTTAKHFPGHGDTGTDSHYALPVITHDRQRLDSLELYPFRKLIDAGLSGMMVAHLSIPQLDSTKDLASTLSKPIVTDLLREELGFDGLIYTDAMNMKAVADHYPPGVADAMALYAGNDLLEFTQDVPKAIAEVKKLIRQGKIRQRDLDARCKKVLAAKEWLGLNRYQPVVLDSLVHDLNPGAAQLLNQRLFESAVTTLRNADRLLPLQRLDTLRIATVSIGSDTVTAFQKMLDNYTGMSHYTLPVKPSQADIDRLKTILPAFNLVILGVHVPSVRPTRNYQITPELQAAVEALTGVSQTVVCYFGNAYTLPQFRLEPAQALLLTYQDHPLAEEAAAQAVFGGIATNGRLPVPVGDQFSLKEGLRLESLNRFHYTLPEAVGIDSEYLTRRIDSLVHLAIDSGATPGAEVLLAKDGNVFFRKSYGYHTYDEKIPVQDDDIYDFASVTKISASLPALMRMTDEGKFDVDKTPADYFSEYRRSNKKDITFREILAHQGRLTAWVPFWKSLVRRNGKLKNTLKKDGSLKSRYFSADSSDKYPVRITDDLYLHKKYRKRIYRSIRDTPLLSETKYVYSDLSYYLYPILTECLEGQQFEDYLKQKFYQPLGATTLTYNAYRHFPMDRIVPTEYDSLFRHTQIQGTVHDEGAALLSGLSGHAGLFGSANDLAKLMQMYLNGGTYGGRRYLNEATLKEFARCQFCDQGNRRAIGFDKQSLHPSMNGPAPLSASMDSFGHSGFTGTFTWADPTNGLLYVFFSNRVYPTRENPKLSNMNIRTGVMQIAYEALEREKMSMVEE
ncbi:beta-glucosidase [Catalinimonas alkaloidigena]|uniref:beta-N-acetylhexosaminidase n=1 Tax=Catalinimonas alkaloidigena TaxID=1075417 RepID=A0A1G9SC39_9BACT|nr:glycoside hydrolase family 3 N-terminal domain-containing protein [Catalinimonas alkaloidigena]SDM32887.1 beta-glucosidase [Catalinimonas alkaloidigena]